MLNFELVGIVGVVFTLLDQSDTGITREFVQFLSNRVLTVLVEPADEVVGDFVLVGLTIEVASPSRHVGNKGAWDMRPIAEAFTRWIVTLEARFDVRV